jgi:hypothetical protein
MAIQVSLQPQRTSPRIHLAAALIVAISISGCMAISPGADTASLGAPGSSGQIADKIVYLQDFPIPTGVKWNNDRTLILGEGKTWTGRLAFNTGLSEADTFQFFQEQMTKLGWQPVSLIRSKNSVLTFIRENRAATIEFTSQFSSGTAVSITLTPR